MTVVTLHRAPTCFVCHELPAEYLMHAALPPPADPAERAPVHALPAVVTLVCASCARPYLNWPTLPAGAQLCRLGAGILAALAGAQPRCSVVTCSAAVSKWGRRCEPCAARGEADHVLRSGAELHPDDVVVHVDADAGSAGGLPGHADDRLTGHELTPRRRRGHERRRLVQAAGLRAVEPIPERGKVKRLIRR